MILAVAPLWRLANWKEEYCGITFEKGINRKAFSSISSVWHGLVGISIGQMTLLLEIQ